MTWENSLDVWVNQFYEKDGVVEEEGKKIELYNCKHADFSKDGVCDSSVSKEHRLMHYLKCHYSNKPGIDRETFTKNYMQYLVEERKKLV